MKRILAIITLSFLAISCEQKTNSNIESALKETQLSKKLDTILKQNVENDLLEEKLKNDASDIYINFVKKENSLNDYPVVFETGIKASKGYSWVKLRTAIFDSEFPDLEKYKNYDKIAFQLLGKMKDVDAMNLKENTPYLVNGKFIEKGWHGQELYYPYNPTFIDGKLNFDNITYQITSIKPLEK